MISPKEVSQDIQYSKKFSICSMVTKMDQYDGLIKSLDERGFTEENCEFLYLDNTKSNSMDAYQAIRHFLTMAKGEYIVLCHQDILFIDDFDKLVTELENLEKVDSSWALAGNAGGRAIKDVVLRITEKDGIEKKSDNLPIKVDSLDENLIIVKASACLGTSLDLAGFHFYGTDLCLQADLKGFSAYVIDFHLNHYGDGVMGKSFYDLQKLFINKYSRAFSSRLIQTTVTKIYISSNKIFNLIFNTKIMMFFFKEVFKWKKKINQ